MVHTMGGTNTFAFTSINVSSLFKECEDMNPSSGVTYYTGTDASPKSGNTGMTFDAQSEFCAYTIVPGTDLPLGKYKLFVRAKDSAQVTDDLTIYIHNNMDVRVVTNTSRTLTGAWSYVSTDVVLDSDDEGDDVAIFIQKKTTTANTIDVDYVLWVPISLDNGNGPQDIAHQALVDKQLKRELVGR